MEREKIEKKYQWNLEDLYSSIEEYENDIKKLNDYQTIIASLTEQGTLYLDSNSKNNIFITKAEEEKRLQEENTQKTNGRKQKRRSSRSAFPVDKDHCADLHLARGTICSLITAMSRSSSS